MIIASGQGITPKQLEENSVIRRAESHKINTTFKVPTFFQDASGGAYIKESSSSGHAYIDGKSVYSTNYTYANTSSLDIVLHVPQLIKTQKIKIVSTKIDDPEKLIIKSFSFTSESPQTCYYYDPSGRCYYLIQIRNSEIGMAFKYSKKFDDIRNCTLPDNLTIEKDGIYLTEHYVCIEDYASNVSGDYAKTLHKLSSDEETAYKNGTFEMSFTCNFEISFIEFK